MKQTRIILGVVVLLASTPAFAELVSDSRVWTERYRVDGPSPTLTINNIWGSIRVRTGEPGEIAVTVDERRTAPTQALFERSLEILSLNVDADTEGVYMQVGDVERDWRRRNRCRGCRVDYQFVVVVPPGTIVDVGTVNDGRIDIADVAGAVTASNVNGPVVVAGIRECTAVESVNGRVDLKFARPPNQDCAVETINGDITLGLPSGSGLDLAFDLYNGRIRSEMEVDALTLPAKVTRTEYDGGYRYQVEQLAGVRVGRGGPTFSMTSLNGDVRIVENR